MENNETRTGVFFGMDPIKQIVNHYLEWAEVKEDQIFCAEDVMSKNTPTGASIIVGIDGLRCEGGTDEVKLVLSSGLYEITVKTVDVNDELDIRFPSTFHVQGTYGHMKDGHLDILTDEEKIFRDVVQNQLDGRDDEFAQRFMDDNRRDIGGRGLILLEKIKSEIAANDILSENDVTPIQLMSVFIEITRQYVAACKDEESWEEKKNTLEEKLENIQNKECKKAKKVMNDIEIAANKIESDQAIAKYCANQIKAAVDPVMTLQLKN